MHLVGLHLMQIAWLNHLGVMDRLGMRAGSVDPFAHCLGLEILGDLNRHNPTAMTPRVNTQLPTICVKR